MQSSTEPAPAARFAAWNRRIHFYLGLYLLVFLWLFSLTGLLLNHPAWTFAEFWANRRQTSLELPIQPPPPGSDLVQAQNILSQTGMRGEIEWTRARTGTNRLDFRASRPGHMFDIKADLEHRRASIQRTDLNAWGVVRILHTFTGVRLGDSRNERDWIMTTVWALAMDAVALGLILMVLGSLYMWWCQKQKRQLGLVALSLGTLTCSLFAIGLRWFA